MKLTRDVANDLMTVVLAGEASADTRSLLDEFLATDPELARRFEALRAESLTFPPTPEPVPTAEKRALDATRERLKARSSTFAVALVFTLLPLSFVFEGSRMTFLLVRDAPAIAIAWWATAAVMWTWHFIIRRKLRVSGL